MSRKHRSYAAHTVKILIGLQEINIQTEHSPLAQEGP